MELYVAGIINLFLDVVKQHIRFISFQLLNLSLNLKFSRFVSFVWSIGVWW
jgi:hypothetical protein